MKKFFYLLASAALLLGACTKDEDPSLKVSPESLAFDGSASSKNVTIESNTAWEITGIKDWVSINKTSGNGNETIIVTVLENDGLDRECTVNISSSAAPATIKISQTGRPNLNVSEKDLEFGSEAGEKEVTVKTNKDWTVQNNCDWITVTPSSGKASDSEQTVKIAVAANTESERTGELTFAIDAETSVNVSLRQVGSVLEYGGVNIECISEVPHTRGLGSSSTCIVAGIVAAYAFVGRSEERQEILDLATEIEGHPDNVAPAIFGGLTVSVMYSDKVKTLNIPVHNEYRFVTLIPPFTLSTELSRKVLPQTISRQDAIANVSHLALAVASLINGYDEGLKLGFKDRLHQPYRGHLIKGYHEIMRTLDEDSMVLGSYLSGAGPSLMALIKAEDTMGVVRIKEELGTLLDGWQVIKLELDQRGYTCDYE